MDHTDVRHEFDHLYWIRDRILEAADAPSVHFTEATPPTIRDLRATLVHELDVQWSWRRRLRGSDRTTFPPDDVELRPDDFPALESVRARWATDEAEMRGWLAGISDDDLEGPCHAEVSGSHPMWFHLQHLYTHGIQQFSDAAVLLTQAGRSPGELDFLDFVQERAPTG